MKSILVFVVVAIIVQLSLARNNGPIATRDFEFVEDVSLKNGKSGKVKESSEIWILDPNNELCSLLRCGEDGICLLQDRFTAVCVSKDEADQMGSKIVPVNKAPKGFLNFDDSAFDDDNDDDDEDYDDDDDEDYADDFQEDQRRSDAPILNKKPFAQKQCSNCPVVRPVFLCGSDNRTYSSLCRLHYHNCIHGELVKVVCKGFCPCRDNNSLGARSEKKRKRKDRFLSKLRDTVNDEATERENTVRSPSQLKKKSRRTGNDASEDLEEQNDVEVPQLIKRPEKKIRNKSRQKHEKYWTKKRTNVDRAKKGKESKKLANSVWQNKECSEDELRSMGDRMVDWFSVIMTETRRRPPKFFPGPSWCKKEVSWMLGHLDQDSDSQLSPKELYRLEHDDRELCIKPFIDRCDLNKDGLISGREWCKCFHEAERPCAALRRTTKDLLGGYIPECDSEGYYQPLQCQLSASVCWCVDKHGIEVKGSRLRSKPDCESMMSKGRKSRYHEDDDAEEDSEEAGEGSGDTSLEI